MRVCCKQGSVDVVRSQRSLVMGLSFVGCVVVASVIVLMTAMAFLGACLSMYVMEKFLTFMAKD